MPSRQPQSPTRGASNPKAQAKPNARSGAPNAGRNPGNRPPAGGARRPANTNGAAGSAVAATAARPSNRPRTGDTGGNNNNNNTTMMIGIVAVAAVLIVGIVAVLMMSGGGTTTDQQPAPDNPPTRPTESEPIAANPPANTPTPPPDSGTNNPPPANHNRTTTTSGHTTTTAGHPDTDAEEERRIREMREQREREQREREMRERQNPNGTGSNNNNNNPGAGGDFNPFAGARVPRVKPGGPVDVTRAEQFLGDGLAEAVPHYRPMRPNTGWQVYERPLGNGQANVELFYDSVYWQAGQMGDQEVLRTSDGALLRVYPMTPIDIPGDHRNAEPGMLLAGAVNMIRENDKQRIPNFRLLQESWSHLDTFWRYDTCFSSGTQERGGLCVRVVLLDFQPTRAELAVVELAISMQLPQARQRELFGVGTTSLATARLKR